MAVELEYTPSSGTWIIYLCFINTHTHTYVHLYITYAHGFQEDSRDFLSHKLYMKDCIFPICFPEEGIIIHFYLYYFNQRKMLTNFCFNLHFSTNKMEHFIMVIHYL